MCRTVFRLLGLLVLAAVLLDATAVLAADPPRKRKRVIQLDDECWDAPARPGLLLTWPHTTLDRAALTELAKGGGPRAAEAWLRLAEQDWGTDQLLRAASEYQHAAEFAPLRPLATLRRAQVLDRLTRVTEAVPLLVPLVDELPRGPLREAVLLELSAALADRSMTWGMVQSALEQPGREWAAQAWRMVGQGCYRDCRATDAVDALERSLQLGPLDVDAPATYVTLLRGLTWQHDTEGLARVRAAMTTSLGPAGPWRRAHPSLGAAATEALRVADLPDEVPPTTCSLFNWELTPAWAASLERCGVTSALPLRLHVGEDRAVQSVDVEGPAAACVREEATKWKVRAQSCALELLVWPVPVTKSVPADAPAPSK